MDIKTKIWVEVDGEPVFGRGRMLLLKAIDRYGSINKASREVNISYRKAWSYIQTMEQRLSIKLVNKQTGGLRGGGATLTEEARDFIKRYELIEKKINNYADKEFKEHFRL